MSTAFPLCLRAGSPWPAGKHGHERADLLGTAVAVGMLFVLPSMQVRHFFHHPVLGTKLPVPAPH